MEALVVQRRAFLDPSQYQSFIETARHLWAEGAAA